MKGTLLVALTEGMHRAVILYRAFRFSIALGSAKHTLDSCHYARSLSEDLRISPCNILF